MYKMVLFAISKRGSTCVLRAVQNLRSYHVSSVNSFDVKTNTNQTSDTNTQPTTVYDIVISGGGMVGTAMASILGQNELFKDMKIALIESSDEKKEFKLPHTHSNRVSALSKTSVELFKSLDAFSYIENARCCPVKQMQVWDACSDSLINFKSNDLTDLAVIVENDLIQASLYDSLKKCTNVNVLYSAKIKDINNDDEQFVRIKMDENSFINTKLLIGSDGYNSFVRSKANIDSTSIDYDQFAIVATLKLNQRDNFTAWQRFLPTGPLALLPLNDEYSSLVWSIKKGASRELMNLNDEEFVKRLNHAFIDESYKNSFATTVDQILDNSLDFFSNSFKQDRLIAEKVRQLPPKIESCVPNSRAFFPLSYSNANNYMSKRIALIGDAAHRIHPLAGQGVNLGFGDVICLADKLTENVKSGIDLGSRIFLESYESDRLKEAYPKMMFIHFLNTLYTTNSISQNNLIQTPVVLLRSLGLTLSNRISFVKNFFAKEAMK